MDDGGIATRTGYPMNRPDPHQSTVIIVDDEGSTRDSLEFLITAADYQCLSFASGEAFLAAPLPRVPRCLLLDLQLEGQNGLQVQQELNVRGSPLPILFLSGDESITRAVSAMREGAMDFLQKPSAPEVLLSRVEQALQASADGYDRRKSEHRDATLLAGLTNRERQILALLVEGNTNKEAARVLDISVRTVETHRAHLMDKLQARTLADLVRVWLNCQHAGN